MDDRKAVSEFFHDISIATIDLVKGSNKQVAIATNKGIGDYATQVDIAVEDFIVAEINKHFPRDQILAEEGHAHTEIQDSRIWLIDPICGTSNLGKGINNFCTNIALVENKNVIASCVIDHSQGEYFWSTGNSVVYVNDKSVQQPDEDLGQKIDVNFGSVRKVDDILRQKHNNCVRKIIDETNFDVISLSSSLSFAYAAVGKTDGFISMSDHPWDIAAASFLVQQAGGRITAIDGSPWTVNTVGSIGGRTPEIHQKLLNLFLDS